jgi:hypothetical protein
MVRLFLTIAAATVLAAPASAGEIPAFARKYGVSCNLCHSPIPRLTAFGETFAANGFRMSSLEPVRDTIDTGDPLLELARTVPLAFRADAYIRAYTDGAAVTDFGTPYSLKILSGGPISSKISYYFYFFLFERGEIGGIEDAYLHVNEIAGAPLDLTVGQFQVSDPLFKRELRLEIEDYAVYRARVGLQPADLTYDRGLLLAADLAGFTVSAEVVNGNGRGEAQPDRRLDDNKFKNVMGHITRDITPNLRLGAMGYYGQQRGTPEVGPDTLVNTLWMVGGDATISVGPVELNGQFLHREDDNASFTTGEPTVEVDGGFAELIVAPPRSRWYGVALWNLVDASAPLLDVRLGGPAGVTRYHTLTGGLGRVVRRHVRVYGEATWDIELEEARFGLGVTAAF